jgi:putative transposase
MRNTRLSGHGIYRTEYHVAWVTKYRQPVLDSKAGKHLAEFIPVLVETIPGCELIECNVQPDHVHIAIIIPPKYAVSDVIGQIKSKSSGDLWRHFKGFQRTYRKNNSIWSPGFFVRTVGVGEDEIRKYIREQGARSKEVM